MQTQTVDGDSYVVTSKRYSAYSPFSSLRSILVGVSGKSIYGPYERPPFPIIIDTPTFRDVMQNINGSDLVMFSTIYGTGILWSYVISRPFTQIMQRLVVYHGMSHLFFFVSLTLLVSVPFRRLTGFSDNGLRWRKPEDKLRKYDLTSEFERATIWGRWVSKVRD